MRFCCCCCGWLQQLVSCADGTSQLRHSAPRLLRQLRHCRQVHNCRVGMLQQCLQAAPEGASCSRLLRQLALHVLQLLIALAACLLHGPLHELLAVGCFLQGRSTAQHSTALSLCASKHVR